jgi:hypothetical protein
MLLLLLLLLLCIAGRERRRRDLNLNRARRQRHPPTRALGVQKNNKTKNHRPTPTVGLPAARTPSLVDHYWILPEGGRRCT